MESTFIDLFLFTYLQSLMNRIMQNLIMKIILFTWPILKNHHWVIMANTYVQQKMWLGEMINLASRVISSGTITNSKNSTLGSRVGFGLRVESKFKNWNSHYFPINGMWLSKIGDSIFRSIGTEINIGLENRSKLGKDIRVNIDSKMGTETQSWRSGSYSHSSQSHSMENLPICPKF